MNLSQIEHYNIDHLPTPEEEKKMVNFLFKHLENYGDPKYQIQLCVDYALSRNDRYGGDIYTIYDKEFDQLVGVLVMNKTGMSGYIPENILVYIATDSDYRGNGIGKKLIMKAIEDIPKDESIALHCDFSNPAKRLYERLGFEAKYFEMRR